MAGFDAQAAKAAGYSDDEIAQLNKQIEAARAAGYSDAEIQAHLSEQPSAAPNNEWLAPQPAQTSAPQMTGPLRYLAGAGSYALKGAEGTLGIPGDIESLIRGGINKLLLPDDFKSAFNDPNSMLSHPSFPSGQSIQDTTNAASERLGGPKLTDNPSLVPQNKAERFGAAAAEAAGGAAPFGIGAVPLGVVSGLAGQGAREAFPGNKVLPLIASVAAASPLGLESDLPAIAKSLGNSKTLQEAGTYLQDAAQSWLDNLPFRVNAAEKPLTDKVPGSAPVQLNNYTGALYTLQRQGGKAAGSMQAMAPQDFKMLNNLSDEADLLKPPGGGPAELTFDEARALRSKIAKAQIQAPGNQMQPEMAKNLYAALNRDISKTAADHDALPEWEAFNQQSQNLYQKGETFNQYLRNGSKEIGPDQAAAKALPSNLSKGSRDLGTIREEMPETADELAAAFLHATPNRWHTLSPEAQSALVADPANQQALNHLIPKKASGPSNDLSAIRAGEIGAAGVGLGSRLLLGHDASNVLGGSDLGMLLGQSYPFLKRAYNRTTSPSALKRAGLGAAIGGPEAEDQNNSLMPQK